MNLVVLALAQFLLALDYSIVYVALPGIADDLGLDLGTAQWVVSAYAVPFAGFLLVGGRLADRVGASRLFVAATALFGVASVAGGLAGDGAVLLAARGAQGVAAALLQPAILGLIGMSFAPGPARTRALSVWGAVGASGLAAGVVLGGLLTRASWRWTFLVNVPVTVFCAVGGLLWLAAQGATRRRVPLRASLLGTGAALAVVLALTFAGSLVAWTLAAVLAAAFLANERYSPAPLVDRSLRRIRSLRLGAAATALYMASVGSEFYVVTLLLQRLRGYEPLLAGIAFLPLAAMVTLGSSATAATIRRLGTARTLSAAFGLAAAGLAALAAGGGGSYVTGLLPGLLVSGFAHGMIYTSMFILGARDVPPEQQSSAAALLTTSQYLSGAVTVATLTLVLAGNHFGAAFWITAGCAALGAALSLRRPRPPLAGPARPTEDHASPTPA
ncbi:MFS transporter [Dactylosporangium sp. NPDC005572]|uniref:MFS transporter n=1 Tax=Dactylosporangium sp. NPDC005572 TaxID=3156889 RepID=UPI0033A14222